MLPDTTPCMLNTCMQHCFTMHTASTELAINIPSTCNLFSMQKDHIIPFCSYVCADGQKILLGAYSDVSIPCTVSVPFRDVLHIVCACGLCILLYMVLHCHIGDRNVSCLLRPRRYHSAGVGATIGGGKDHMTFWQAKRGWWAGCAQCQILVARKGGLDVLYSQGGQDGHSALPRYSGGYQHT